jgi:hypothetical protein
MMKGWRGGKPVIYCCVRIAMQNNASEEATWLGIF